MLNKIKERLVFVATGIGMVFLFALYLFEHFKTYGDELTVIEGSENLWGFQFITENVGFIAVIAVIVVVLVVMLWTIYKDRRGRG